MPAGAVLLIEDETLLRWFPPLRYCWARKGEQARVPITGRNAKRVLLGAINPRTGHRILRRGLNLRQPDFQAFLRQLRRCYAGRQIWLLLDEAPSHTAGQSQQLAAQLDIRLIWLPKQCPELNAMDQLWKEVKDEIVANHQFESIDQAAESAENWILQLSHRQALRKAGVLSKNYWLKDLSK
jgi:transposase